MARNRSPIFKLQGTIYDLTFVESKAYGSHTRAPRGTHKEAECNETLTRNYKRTSVLNAAGSPVNRALKQACGNFIQRNLWEKILSRMRTCKSNEVVELLGTLEGLELNECYALKRFGDPVRTEVKKGQKNLEVLLHRTEHPLFERKLKADCYYYELTIIWISKENQYTTESMKTEWISMADPPSSYAFAFKKPKAAQFYLLCLKLQAGKEQRVKDVFPAMGARIIESGSV